MNLQDSTKIQVGEYRTFLRGEYGKLFHQELALYSSINTLCTRKGLTVEELLELLEELPDRSKK